MNTTTQLTLWLCLIVTVNVQLYFIACRLGRMFKIMREDRHPYWHDSMSGLTHRNGDYLGRIIAILEQEDDAADSDGASERIFGPSCLRYQANPEGAESDPVSKQS